MDGVAATLVVLTEHPDVLALLPADSVFAGPAGLDTPLPFVAVNSISIVDLEESAPGATRFVTERVRMTFVGRNYPEQQALKRLVRRATADRLNPPVSGISGVTIHTDSAGPDFYDDAYAGWRGSQDLKVKYTEQR